MVENDITSRDELFDGHEGRSTSRELALQDAGKARIPRDAASFGFEKTSFAAWAVNRLVAHGPLDFAAVETRFTATLEAPQQDQRTQVATWRYEGFDDQPKLTVLHTTPFSGAHASASDVPAQ